MILLKNFFESSSFDPAHHDRANLSEIQQVKLLRKYNIENGKTI